MESFRQPSVQAADEPAGEDRALRQDKKKPKDVQEALEAIYRQMHKPR